MACLLTLAGLLAGCGGPTDVVDSKLPAGTGKAMNPTGKPQTPDQQQMAQYQQQAGSSADAMAKQAYEGFKQGRGK